MTLKQWLDLRWLTLHTTSRREIADLLAVVDRDLAASRTPGLPADWRLNIAYNAAMQCAVAALAASGYRAARDSHHYRVIQSLAFTMGVELALIDQLEHLRKKRNMGEYERAGIASDQEANETIELAAQLRRLLQAWLKENHPSLLS